MIFLALILNFNFANAAAPCPEGIWDFGPRIALAKMVCEPQATKAQLSFCHRETYLQTHICTGRSELIDCIQKENFWLCEEGGTYPFHASLKLLDSEKMEYQFKSTFNEGRLLGKKIP